ncbi:MAG: hypothetical protein DBY17_02260 [Oscillospiraceae bacterium]|nr:MAG: hypothetical protein DBY17_02260 [Oscillospiraceae bacterium]
MVNGCHASPEAYKPAGAAQARQGRCPAFGRRGTSPAGQMPRLRQARAAGQREGMVNGCHAPA